MHSAAIVARLAVGALQRERADEARALLLAAVAVLDDDAADES
jgi:hypothetical protein